MGSLIGEKYSGGGLGLKYRGVGEETVWRAAPECR